MKKIALMVFFLLKFTLTEAQIGVGTTTPEAALDITSSTNGVLVPRVALTSKNSSSPVVNPNGGAIVNGTLIYNTATAGATPNNVVPGFYYWEGAAWIAVNGDGSKNWSLLGNSGTNSTNNFIGTTDNTDVVFKRNNTNAGLLHSSNTAFGVSAFSNNTAGIDNTAIGQNTLLTNTSGNSAVAVGQNALRGNTTGASNVAVGQGALYTNSTGNYNTAIGQNALNLNTASNNLAIGRLALNTNSTGTQNIAVGNSTLFNSTTSSNNVAVGYNSLSTNTIGARNIGIGTTTLSLNSTGNDNLAIGHGTLAANTMSNNLAIGSNALDANTSGTPNLAIGVDALGANVTGTNNAAVGYNTLLLNTGSGNVALGQTAGNSNTTGSNNTFIGYNSDAGGGGLSNATAIGANSVVNASNSIVLGNAANVGIGTNNPVYAKLQVVGFSIFTATNTAFTGTTRAPYIRGNDTYSTATTPDYSWYNSDQTGMFHPAASTVAFCANGVGETMRINGSGNVGIGCNAPAYKLHVIGDISSSATVRSTFAVVTGAIAACSDGRYKKNILPLKSSLDKVMQLRPVTYNWKTEEFPNKHFTNDLQIGFIAQELEKIIPQVVHTDVADNNYKSVDYGRLTPVLVEAMKEQQVQIEKLQKEVEELKKAKSEYDSLKAEIEAIKNSLKTSAQN